MRFLKDHDYNPLRAKLLLKDGESRGVGFVEMDNEIEAELAIEELNQSEYCGRKLFINMANE